MLSTYSWKARCTRSKWVMTLPRSRALFAASLHSRTERMRFQMITLWNSFSRLCSFGGSSTPLSCKSKGQNAIKMFGFVQKNLQALASSCACVCVGLCFFFYVCAYTFNPKLYGLFLPDLSLLGGYSRCYFYTGAKCFQVCARLSVCVCVLRACVTIPQGSSNMHLANGCSRKADTFRRLCEIASPKRSSYYCE